MKEKLLFCALSRLMDFADGFYRFSVGFLAHHFLHVHFHSGIHVALPHIASGFHLFHRQVSVFASLFDKQFFLFLSKAGLVNLFMAVLYSSLMSLVFSFMRFFIQPLSHFLPLGHLQPSLVPLSQPQSSFLLFSLWCLLCIFFMHLLLHRFI